MPVTCSPQDNAFVMATNSSSPLTQLRRDAQKALSTAPQSVVSKDATPPSGNKHDYMSQAPYFWPNPKTADHLPYIRRDGERNPEINKISDHQTMDRMVSAVETLALDYYFESDEACAAKAAQLLRAWFIDLPTRMNPNLQCCTCFKLDGNFWAAIHGGRFNDRRATRIEAYRRGMQAILRGAGYSFVLGCNHPIWAFAWVDSWLA